MSTFSNLEKHHAAVREVSMRRRVYPRWVETRKMTKAQSERGIALMDEIAADYLELANGERLI